MNENKYKTIYTDIMPAYRESEDYCRMTLDMLKHAITGMDADLTRTSIVQNGHLSWITYASMSRMRL